MGPLIDRTENNELINANTAIDTKFTEIHSNHASLPFFTLYLSHFAFDISVGNHFAFPIFSPTNQIRRKNKDLEVMSDIHFITFNEITRFRMFLLV